MLCVKTCRHLRTMRHLKSFRSCPTSTGIPMWRVEIWRLFREDAALENRAAQRRDLARAWHSHLGRTRQARTG